MIKIRHVKIPKEIIYNTSMNDKRVILFSYFYSKWGLDDTIGFSCDTAVKWCGFGCDYHKGKINEQITDLINKFVLDGYMDISEDIFRNNCNIATLNIEKFDSNNQFALIYFDEIQKIKDFKLHIEDEKNINRMSAAILLLVLSYLRVNMLRRQEGYIGNQSDKPEFCYRYYINIEDDIGLSSRYISRAVDILIKLDLIAKSILPRYKDEYNNWHTESTLFVNKHKYDKQGKLDHNYNYLQELQWGIEYIKDRKYLKKKFDQNTESG